LKKEKIEKVISIGGYMSLPIIIAAKILKLSIILFEPNMVLGRGNKFFLNFSKKIFCYSDKIANFPKKHFHKIELINPLVLKSFYEKKQINKSDEKFCFLISGGSQGAKFFDEFMKEIMADIAKNSSIKIIQQTAVENIKNLKKFYDTENIENKIFNFEEKFIDLINMSDLCITRAGATSLAEIAHLNKPFIAVPLPSAKDDHQMSNAKFYEEKKCCWVLDQRNIKKEELLSMLINILKDKNDLIEKKLNLEKLNSNNSWNDINQKLRKIVNEN
jgi:UDP-N-acetylglucosamine--N-acetylmuramyl-(pentapeptide) pyrophosphoryl-undecaprenol N-acetylglucosamine transferase